MLPRCKIFGAVKADSKRMTALRISALPAVARLETGINRLKYVKLHASSEIPMCRRLWDIRIEPKLVLHGNDESEPGRTWDLAVVRMLACTTSNKDISTLIRIPFRKGEALSA